MSIGARKSMPRGDFGVFEGEQVVAGTLAFQGQRPAPALAHEGDTVYLLVQAEVRKVEFSRNADGDLVRRHTLRVVEATEAPEPMRDDVVVSINRARDEREGREPLPFEGDPLEMSADELAEYVKTLTPGQMETLEQMLNDREAELDAEDES